MINILIISGIILTLVFFVYNKYILGLSAEKNVLHSILFIFSSILLAWGVNKIWNPNPIQGVIKNPKKKPDDDTDPAPSIGNILNELNEKECPKK